MSRVKRRNSCFLWESVALFIWALLDSYFDTEAIWDVRNWIGQFKQMRSNSASITTSEDEACFTSVLVRPLCPLTVTCVLPHPGRPSLLCPRGPLAILSLQPRTIPFMGHKASDTTVLCSILYICHFYFYVLCSSYLCMHELSQIEPTIEMEIIPVSQWRRGNNFLLFKA